MSTHFELYDPRRASMAYALKGLGNTFVLIVQGAKWIENGSCLRGSPDNVDFNLGTGMRTVASSSAECRQIKLNSHRERHYKRAQTTSPLSWLLAMARTRPPSMPAARSTVPPAATISATGICGPPTERQPLSHRRSPPFRPPSIARAPSPVQTRTKAPLLPVTAFCESPTAQS